MALDPSDFNELKRAFFDAMRDANDLGLGTGSAMGAGSRGGGGGGSGLDSATQERINQIRAETEARKKEQNEKDTLNRLLDEEIEYREKNNIALTAEQESRKALRDAERALEAQTKALDASIKKTNDAFQSLGKAILDPKTGFEKYQKGIEEAGNAVGTIAAKTGKYGPLLEVAIKGLTNLNVAFLKQADALLKQSDELAKVGAAGQLTTKQILDLAHQAGFTTKNMAGLFKATASLGTDMMSLGSSTTASVKEFGKLAERNDAVLAGFRRLGFSQDEFVQAQSDSIRLMTQQGRFVVSDMRNTEKLRSITYEYAQNLSVLSSLTGDSIEQSKKEQEAAQAEFTVRMKLAALSVEEKDLKERFKTAGADEQSSINARLKQIEGERFFGDTVLPMMRKVLDPTQFKGLQDVYSSRTISTMEASGLNQLMQGKLIPLVRGAENIKTGTSDEALRDQARYISEFQKQLQSGAETQIRRFAVGGGPAVYKGAEEGMRLLGLSEKAGAQQSMKIDPEEMFKAFQKIRDTRESKGPVAEDPSQKLRTAAEKFERSVQIFSEKAINAFNPLTNGLTLATGSAMAFSAALATATGILAALSVKSIFGKVAPLLGRLLPAAGAATATGAAATGAAATGAAATGAAATGAATAAGAGLAAGLGAGAAGLGIGYGLGHYGINPMINAMIRHQTGDKEATLGTRIYDLLHGERDKKLLTSDEREMQEMQKKNVKGVDDNNSYLKKLTETVASLDKTLKKQLEEDYIPGQIDGTGEPTRPAPPAPSSSAPAPPIQPSKPFEGSKKEFSDKMYSTLLEEAKKAGLKNPETIAQLGVAQSALETGYGKRLAGGNNYFGIKDFTKGGGNYQTTKEFINGKEVTVRDKFRRYGSMEESAADYIQFLMKNPKYAKVLESQTPEDATKLVREAGYATDPRYTAKLREIIASIMATQQQTSQSSQVSKAPVETTPPTETLINRTRRSLGLPVEESRPVKVSENNVTKTPLGTSDAAKENIPKVQLGGVIEGPQEGYNVIAHGREAVVPLTDSPEKIRKHLQWIEENFAVTKKVSGEVGGKVVDKLGIENPVASALTEKAGGRITKELLKRLVPELAMIDKVASIAGNVGNISDIATSDSKAMDKVIDLIKLHPKVKAITFAYEFIKPYLDKANMASDSKSAVPELPKPDLTDIASESRSAIPELPKPDLTSNTVTEPQVRTISTVPPITAVNPMEEQNNMTAMTEILTEMLSTKFDAMIEKLNESNDIASQQLRAART